ncbi:cytochrome c oxidase subunit II [Rhodobium gokarnense]|nr:cytochrome c oxidase subunit II [Rhodobium gokarnense]
MRLAAHVLAAFAALTGFIGAALADQPVPWGISMQDAATPVMEDIHWFNAFTLYIAVGVTLLVAVLMVLVIIKFNASANPTPSKRSHHTMLEVVWTLVPILILVAIAVPSFRLLYKELEVPEADLTIKATGYQWYWGFEYTDDGYDGLSFDSIMLADDERAERIEKQGLTERDVPRLLAVDNQVIVPVGKVVRVQVTAADVIHSFAVPAFGVKVDAVPGRLNETWFQAERPGVYFGQCSELCGSRHAFMPISVRAVTEEQFATWSAAAKDDIDAAYKGLMASIKADRKAIDVAKR